VRRGSSRSAATRRARSSLARSAPQTSSPSAAIEAVEEKTDGVGIDAALECVGTDQAISTSFAIARAGSTVGFVGVPHGGELPVGEMFSRNMDC